MSLTSAPLPRRRSRPVRRAAALAAGAALALALAGCGSMSGGSTPTASSGARGNAGAAGTIVTVPAGKRTVAPNLSGATVDGKSLKLSDYAGKIVVLNVWGSWCDPCRAEAPNLEAVAHATAAKGVQFVGINIGDHGTAQSKSFERDFKISYPSLYDPESRLLLKFPRGTLSPQGIPNTLILDRQHKIAVRALTPLTTGQLSKALDPIIAEK